MDHRESSRNIALRGGGSRRRPPRRCGGRWVLDECHYMNDSQRGTSGRNRSISLPNRRCSWWRSRPPWPNAASSPELDGSGDGPRPTLVMSDHPPVPLASASECKGASPAQRREDGPAIATVKCGALKGERRKGHEFETTPAGGRPSLRGAPDGRARHAARHLFHLQPAAPATRRAPTSARICLVRRSDRCGDRTAGLTPFVAAIAMSAVREGGHADALRRGIASHAHAGCCRPGRN